MKWKKNHWNGMELEWKWNGKWNGMEWKFNGKKYNKSKGKINRWNGMEMEWKNEKNYIQYFWKWNGDGNKMEDWYRIEC